MAENAKLMTTLDEDDDHAMLRGGSAISAKARATPYLAATTSTPTARRERASEARGTRSTASLSLTMLARPLAALVLLCAATARALVAPAGPPPLESYRESLRLTPFPDGKVLSDFAFTLDGPWLEAGTDVSCNAVGAPSSPSLRLSSFPR